MAKVARMTKTDELGNVVILEKERIIEEKGLLDYEDAKTLVMILANNLFDNFESRVFAEPTDTPYVGVDDDGYVFSTELKQIEDRGEEPTSGDLTHIMYNLAEKIRFYEDKFIVEDLQVNSDAMEKIKKYLYSRTSEIMEEDDDFENPIAEGYARCISDIRKYINDNDIDIPKGSYNIIIAALRHFLHNLEVEYFEDEENVEIETPVLEGYSKCTSDFIGIVVLNNTMF